MLAGGSTGEQVTEEQLTEAYAHASRPVLVQIFNQAATLRATTWRTQKATMERVIPVLRALVANDADRRFHRHFGQLGYALADQRTPDFPGALAALDEAVTIRDAAGDRGWALYELVRARCQIATDEDFVAGRPSSAQLRDLVLADLRVAARIPWVRAIVEHEQPYAAWLALNGVTPV